jgi:hypothetical protein
MILLNMFACFLLVNQQTIAQATIGGCTIFPPDNWWNARVDKLPVHPKSEQWVKAIGTSSTPLKADFGSGLFEGSTIGIPFIVVPSNEPLVSITYVESGDESDPGPMPIPDTAPVEGEL